MHYDGMWINTEKSRIRNESAINTVPLTIGRLAAWHLSGGPVGPPAWWPATLNVAGGDATKEGVLS